MLETDHKYKPASKLASDAFTWPGFIIYLDGQRLDRRSTTLDESLYETQFILKRPGHFIHSDQQLSLSDNDGDSHFRLKGVRGTHGSQKSLHLIVNEDPTLLRGVTNAAGFIKAFVYGPYSAESLDHAESYAHNTVFRALSLLSLRFDSPLAVRRVRIEHLSSRRIRYLQSVPDWQVSVPPFIKINMPDLMLTCASFYREALTSSSPLYSFLCYFKSIKVIQHARREVFKGKKYSKERLPNSEHEALSWIREVYFGDDIAWNPSFLKHIKPESIRWGMSFGDIIDNVFRPKRNEIAHALEDESKLLNPDDSETVHQVRLMLPLIKLIARYMARTTYPELLLPAHRYLQSDNDLEPPHSS